MSPIPSFDEWCVAEFGRAFDDEFPPQMADFGQVRALVSCVREYVSHVATLRAPAGEPVAALAEAARDVAMNGYSALRHTNLRNAVARYFTTPPVVSSPPSEAADAIRLAIEDAMLTGTGILRIEHVPPASVSFDPSPAEQGAREEPRVLSATVRDTDSDELHIECRFAYGEKYAAVKVDADKPVLADAICDFLNGKRAPLAAGRVGVAVDDAMVERALATWFGRNVTGTLSERMRAVAEELAASLAGPLVAGEVEAVAKVTEDMLAAALNIPVGYAVRIAYVDTVHGTQYGRWVAHMPTAVANLNDALAALVYADTAKAGES
jgi:hypothetical protein